MVLLVSCYKCACVVFYANSKIVFQYIYHNVMRILDYIKTFIVKAFRLNDYISPKSPFVKSKNATR